MDYIYEARNQLENKPWGATVTSGGFFNAALEAGLRCKACRKDLDSEFRQFARLLAANIDEAVSKARLRIGPSIEKYC